MKQQQGSQRKLALEETLKLAERVKKNDWHEVGEEEDIFLGVLDRIMVIIGKDGIKISYSPQNISFEGPIELAQYSFDSRIEEVYHKVRLKFGVKAKDSDDKTEEGTIYARDILSKDEIIFPK